MSVATPSRKDGEPRGQLTGSPSRSAAMSAGDAPPRAPAPLRDRQRQDQRNGIRRQAVRPRRRVRLAAALAQEVEVETLILVAEDRLHPPIAALRHAMRQIRDDETGDARHERGSRRIARKFGANWIS